MTIKQLRDVTHVIVALIILAIGLIITAGIFFSPFLIAIVTWNFWYILLFTVTWIPAIISGIMTAAVTSAYANIFL